MKILFGLSLCFFLIVSALSIAFYFVLFLPSRDSIKRSIEAHREQIISDCQEQLRQSYSASSPSLKTISDVQKYSDLYIENCKRSHGFE